MATLSESDKRILEIIFNPNQTFGYETQANENQRTEEHIQNGHVETEAEIKAKELEMMAVRHAEQGDIESALSLLNEAENYCSESPSVYNNRAQVLLLKGDKESASSDLDKALELSHYEGNVAGQAFTQRALIHRLNGDDDAALEDFKKGAKMGNSFAKSQIAEMNSYAALCNQMLAQAIDKLRKGESDE
ncbi:tetratricopeptide repeat protein 36 homolog [Dendronephthya gigantea]|uniref:tetratricopeptide repeat protein 36 homolog n=1 Tax=Dendronephthya gigantea TaxID=151771 RepID=UPI00106B75E1|nr:tetratricopeptide repeat protein 36 homolog [Dendronephthya gigantea]